jgi:hypothetical protein
VYSLLKHGIKREHYITFFKTLGNHFIITGDYNAKHTHWKSRLILSKRNQLCKAIEIINLAVLSTGELSYWQTIWQQNITVLLVFSIIKGIAKDYCRTESCLELFSDYFPIVFKVNSKIITKNKPCTFCNVKTKRLYFQELLKTISNNSIPLKTDDNIICAGESFNYAGQQAACNTV